MAILQGPISERTEELVVGLPVREKDILEGIIDIHQEPISERMRMKIVDLLSSYWRRRSVRGSMAFFGVRFRTHRRTDGPRTSHGADRVAQIAEVRFSILKVNFLFFGCSAPLQKR